MPAYVERSIVTVSIISPPPRNGGSCSSSSPRPHSTPMPVGPVTLWPVKARKSTPARLHVDRHLRHGLGGVDDHERADLVGPAGDLGDRVDGAEHVGDPGQRDHLGALGDQLVDVGQVELAVVGEPEPAQRGAGALGEQLPRHDVGVVLHLGDERPRRRGRPASGPRAQARVFATRLIASEAFLVKITSSREGALRKAATLSRPPSNAGGRLGAELVHRAGDVRVVPLEVVDHRVDHDLRLLRGVRAVEVDQRVPVGERPRQDREVSPDQVEPVEQPGQAPVPRCRLSSGHGAQALAAVNRS